MDKPEKDYNDIGSANDWHQSGKYPMDYLACKLERHSRRRVAIGTCMTRVYCDVCRITYLVDSSG